MAATGSAPLDGPEAPKRDKRMSLGQHLLELRRRLVIAAIALVVGMVVAFIITDPIIHWITGPIREIT